MSNEISRKRPKSAAGLKVFVATASVAATIAGWAMLPSNDPPTATASDQPGTQITVNTPGPEDGSVDVPQVQTLPQVQAPQGRFGRSVPFTSTHSSR